MARRRPPADDWEEGLDPDGPSPEDLDRFGDEFQTCPNCGASVYDQAELCARCGHAFNQRPGGLPMWAILTAIAVLGAFVLYWIF